MVAVEDLHDGPIDEPALFHLLNLAGERDAKVLITSRDGPGTVPLTLPDLISRLRAMQLATLGAPDDDLLRRVLTKLFADRQIEVDPGVIGYIATRMERSFAAASRIVAALDRAALAGEGRYAAARGGGSRRDRGRCPGRPLGRRAHSLTVTIQFIEGS